MSLTTKFFILALLAKHCLALVLRDSVLQRMRSNTTESELSAASGTKTDWSYDWMGVVKRFRGDDQPCDTSQQCVGTQPTDTVFKCNCKPGSEERSACSSPKAWHDCQWPRTHDWVSIGQGPFFDISRAAPGGHLIGIADLPAAELLQEGVVVLTDLDDTVVCSGGPPAGIDRTCNGTKKKDLYPGVVEFYYAMSLGSNRHAHWGRTRVSEIVPFSARPHEMKFAMAVKKCTSIDLVMRQRICGCGGEAPCFQADSMACTCFGMNVDDAQYGSFKDLVGFVASNFNRMGETKARNWMYFKKKLAKPAVFVGDNGQGDLVAAQMMLIQSQSLPCKPSDCRGRVVAAFIHDVADECSQPECREAWALHNIFFFANYKEAAEKAAEVGLIPKPAHVQKVADAVDAAVQ